MEQVKLVKYEKSFFHRIWDKLKSIFSKKEESLPKETKESKIENVVVENKEEFVQTDEIRELVRRYESHQITEQEMTEQERNQLVAYYKNKNEELDREIARERAIWKSQVKKLEKSYEVLRARINGF